MGGSPLWSSEGKLASNFDALSDTQNKATAGFHDTPLDQGLCVGTLTGFGGIVVIEAVNSSGAAMTYQFSTNEGGTCFGDQPHTGYDDNAVYVATD